MFCVSAAKHNTLIFSWAILMGYVQAPSFEVVIIRVRRTSLIGSYQIKPHNVKRAGQLRAISLERE